MSTSFWKDLWLLDETLSCRFSKLYRLETEPNASVGDRVGWNGTFCLGEWCRSRVPRGRAVKEFEDLCGLINSVRLNLKKDDTWQVFIWRAKKRRLAVLTELDKRGIDLNLTRCPVCDDDVETVDHSLLFCKQASDTWSKVFDWWDIDEAESLSIGEIFGESASGSMSKIGAKIWQAVKWTCGYLIWQNRNQKVFAKKCWSTPVALNEIQVTSYEWVSKRCKSKHIDWHNWLHSPQSFVYE
ncbi:uncharacterized protein [Rutidosis leptorrhynchoides]|uniref:uncharacterized protein n=1 Tax=Rutidosis leptorrhynchoides TaxID=125765 RepID=UPI003A999039